MSSDLVLRGLYVPLVTPFAPDGSVALDAVERLSYECLDAGAAGIVALGTTGESSALDADERRAVIERCAAACSDRGAQLIVGAGTNNTAVTIAAVQALADTPSVVATLIVVPYYVRPSESGVVAHMRAVAAASPVPLVLYNIPYRTGRAIGAAAILELARTPNICGIKQAVGGIDVDTMEVLSSKPSGFCVLSGDDTHLLPIVLLGGSGGIAAAAHVCTGRFVALVDAALDGKLDDAKAHHEALLPVVQACFAEPNPTVFKGVLHAQGRIPTPDVRLPLLPASTAAVAHALEAIAVASA